MSVAVVATIRIRPGSAAEFEDIFTALAEKVRDNEPGNRLYQLTKSRTEPDTYKVLEIYADDAALTVHRGMPHFKAAGPALGGVFAGAPDIELLDTVN